MTTNTTSTTTSTTTNLAIQIPAASPVASSVASSVPATPLSSTTTQVATATLNSSVLGLPASAATPASAARRTPTSASIPASAVFPLSFSIPSLPGSGASAPNLKVLFLDDQSLNLRMMPALLQKTRLVNQVDLCMTAATAIQKAMENQYDIILLDRTLAAGDGLGHEVAQEMRRRGVQTPIYYHSTDTNASEMAQEVATAGMQGCIPKGSPDTLRQLTACLQQYSR